MNFYTTYQLPLTLISFTEGLSLYHILSVFTLVIWLSTHIPLFFYYQHQTNYIWTSRHNVILYNVTPKHHLLHHKNLYFWTKLTKLLRHQNFEYDNVVQDASCETFFPLIIQVTYNASQGSRTHTIAYGSIDTLTGLIVCFSWTYHK